MGTVAVSVDVWKPLPRWACVLIHQSITILVDEIADVWARIGWVYCLILVVTVAGFPPFGVGAVTVDPSVAISVAHALKGVTR